MYEQPGNLAFVLLKEGVAGRGVVLSRVKFPNRELFNRLDDFLQLARLFLRVINGIFPLHYKQPLAALAVLLKGDYFWQQRLECWYLFRDYFKDFHFHKIIHLVFL